MALDFYYASGSPFSWRVWLALEHKQIPYELRRIDFGADEHRTPEFLSLNPRHKVPALRDGGWSIYESSVIVEYLEDTFPNAPRLLPENPKDRATVRRIMREADLYLWPPCFKLSENFFFRTQDDWDQNAIARAATEIRVELRTLERQLATGFLVNELSAADFSVFPIVAMLHRYELRQPELDLTASFGPQIRQWMDRIRSLPYFDKTYPAHWRVK